MSIINSQPRIGAAGQSTGFKIERSLRFNSADSAYLNRTPASAGNRKTWTWSGWVKRSGLGTAQIFWSSGTSNLETAFYFPSTDKLSIYQFNNPSYEINLGTTQVFRDVGAWYHIVIAVDTTQATSSNRVKLYVNGVQVTAFDTSTYPTLDLLTATNNNVSHMIGRSVDATGYYFPGYLTEINFIDGSAKTPSDFGETDTDTGVWKPKAYSGSYGTNGFYLKFADNSGTTSTTLGKDSSGNGNNWTPNNFYVGPGTTNAEKAGIDSLVDTPTPYGTDTGAGGEVRGNYCTLNPLAKNSGATLSNGNLDWSATGSNQKTLSTIGMSSGKWYCEITVTTATYLLVGIAPSTSSLTTYVGEDSNSYGFGYLGQKWNNGSGSSYSTAPVANDVVGIAFDADAGTLTFYKNGTSLGTAFSSIPANTYHFAVGTDSTAGSVNFGQRFFAYTAPSGFKALCTQNLPTPDIGATSATRANKYFDVVLRNGGGSSGGTYSTTVNMSNGAWLWDKPRNQASSNYLIDSVRGISKYLVSNATQAENTDATFFTNFGSSSFTTGSTDWGTTVTVVDWIWAANGSGSTNNAGSIQSTVSANTEAGFSIVTYTGNGTSGATVGHGLGAVPQMIIAKTRNNLGDWPVYHVSLGNTKNLLLNTLDASTTSSSWWNNTTPTSTLVTLGNNSYINGNTYTFVMYCFAPIAGYSAFGSLTGNGSTDGPMIFTGFAPKYVIIKRTDSTGGWPIIDSVRQTYNQNNTGLLAESSAAEYTNGGAGSLDFLSNGFKLRTTDTWLNASGGTYVYAAFAQNPFKYSLAR